MSTDQTGNVTTVYSLRHGLYLLTVKYIRTACYIKIVFGMITSPFQLIVINY